MSGVHFSANTTIKVGGKRAAGYVVPAGEYVIATYSGSNGGGASNYAFPCFQVYYAPGDTVASTVTTSSTGSAITVSLVTAVGFVNSP